MKSRAAGKAAKNLYEVSTHETLGSSKSRRQLAGRGTDLLGHVVHKSSKMPQATKMAVVNAGHLFFQGFTEVLNRGTFWKLGNRL